MDSNPQISLDKEKRYNYKSDDTIDEFNFLRYVEFFKGILIKYISADSNNCFVVTENSNNIFVWGL